MARYVTLNALGYRLQIIMATIEIQSHYEIAKLDGMEALKECFPDGEADMYNWCFLGQSGVHGSYTKLDDLNEDYLDEDGDPQQITVVVFRPRTVVALYGQVEVKSKEDEQFLRKLAKTTVQEVKDSQRGNL